MMNPTHWTPAMLELMKRTDPFVYVTSGLGEFADPPDTLIPSKAAETAMSNEAELPPARDQYDALIHEYVAALGAAERGSGWTLTILRTVAEKNGERMMQECVSRQWFNAVGSPIQSRRVLAEVAKLCRSYGLDFVFINQRFVNSYLTAASSVDLGLCGVEVNGDQRIEFCDKLRDAIVEGRLTLTSNRQQYSDLVHVQKKPTVNGVQVQYPSSGEGVSCDFIEPLGLCVAYAPDAPGVSEQPDFDAPRAKQRRPGGRRYAAGVL
jgi:hypothetical protein